MAPLLVVPLQLHYGWRVSFYLFGILGVVWSAVWYAWFRDSPQEMPAVATAERAEICESHAPLHARMPWALALRSGALRRIASIAACFAYVNTFFQSWLQTYLVKARGFTTAALVFSTLPYIVGACANITGGIVATCSRSNAD
jgi:sugar phosphate permease